MSLVTSPAGRPPLLDRIARWWRDRTGITEAEENLARTERVRDDARRTLGSTEAALRHARRRFRAQDWPGVYRDRMQDLAE